MGDLLWQGKAECAKHYDVDLWFSERREAEKAAKDICWNKCPVRVECLSYAQEIEYGYGIFGGYTPKERWQLRRSLIRAQQAYVTDRLVDAHRS
jgi:hypothetical protein